MRWVNSKNTSGSLTHKLETPAGTDLAAAYREFWRRILDDAVACAGRVDWRTIAFDILPKETADADAGELTARFWDSRNRRCEHPEYVIASDTFEALMEDRTDEEHDRDLVALYLREFTRLRDVAAAEPVAQLFRRAKSVRPFKVVGAVIDGWLDLQIGQPAPGPLPEYDRKVLAGQPAKMLPNPGGLFDMEWLALMNAVSSALVRYTPEHFKTIECTVRAEGNRLFYEIGCPDFPDEGTTEPGKDVHQAMSRLVAHKMRDGAAFPGMRFVVQVQSDGSAQTQAAVLN